MDILHLILGVVTVVFFILWQRAVSARDSVKRSLENMTDRYDTLKIQTDTYRRQLNTCSSKGSTKQTIGRTHRHTSDLVDDDGIIETAVGVAMVSEALDNDTMVVDEEYVSGGGSFGGGGASSSYDDSARSSSSYDYGSSSDSGGGYDSGGDCD